MLSKNSSHTSKTHSKHSSTLSKKHSAARKIQRFYRIRSHRLNLLRKIVKDKECLTTPLDVGDENLYMYLQEDERQIPLFNIFQFKANRHGIHNAAFLTQFYELLISFEYDNPSEDNGGEHEFRFTKRLNEAGEETLEIEVLVLHMHKYNKTQTERYFLPFIYYILANCKIDIDLDVTYFISITHPLNLSGIVGVHNDESLYTCLTYFNSPLTTELAFNPEKIELEHSCSPIFRFDSQDKLYTLCFHDEYMVHTAPIFESEEVSPSGINPFDVYETMRERVDPKLGTVLEYGKKQDFPTGRDIYQTVYGKQVKLEKKERLDSHGNPLPLKDVQSVFMKPLHRQKVPKPLKRHVIMCFIYYDDDKYTTSIIADSFTEPSSILDRYKINHMEEQIQFSKETVHSIMVDTHLGKLKMVGGKTAKKIRKTK